MTKYQNSIDSRLLSMMSMVECATLPLFLFVNTLLENKRSVEYIMGEVMICRGGSGSGAGKGNKVLISSVFTENTSFIVPEAINNEFSVRIFGGGGGGAFNYTNNYSCGYAGGGGGWMNNDTLSLKSTSIIPITIGLGGNAGNNEGTSGGTTSFGTYLSASGGGGGYILYGNRSYGGSGASGGGSWSANSDTDQLPGNGYQFGGAGSRDKSVAGTSPVRGNGGVWGGGGGRSWSVAYGGTYGGAGGFEEYGTGANINCKSQYGGLPGNNGTNTIGWTNTDIDPATGNYLVGHGACINPGNAYYGGGGFGGNGGNGMCSGGGGYVGNGGKNYGGGGGYGTGANGGNYFGGGGGYYAPGGSGASTKKCGGGGSYGKGGTAEEDGAYGAGGGAGWVSGPTATNGGGGICIIQYYTYQ